MIGDQRGGMIDIEIVRLDGRREMNEEVGKTNLGIGMRRDRREGSIGGRGVEALNERGIAISGGPATEIENLTGDED